MVTKVKDHPYFFLSSVFGCLFTRHFKLSLNSLVANDDTDRDIFDFVMYYIYGQSGPSLLIESTDSMKMFKVKKKQVGRECVSVCV